MSEKREYNTSDARWGNYIPWFIRSGDFQTAGDYILLFKRLGQRLDSVFTYNEARIPNVMQYGDKLEAKSFQRFIHDRAVSLGYQIRQYYSEERIDNECAQRIQNDAEVQVSVRRHNGLQMAQALQGLTEVGQFYLKKRAKQPSKSNSRPKVTDDDVLSAKQAMDAVRELKRDLYYQEICQERLSVLETILISLQPSQAVNELISDIRQFLAEAQIMLEVDIATHQLKPLDEPLLQTKVIDSLLPRLQSRYPERASELANCYHRTLTGDDLDSVFMEAFKSLEEIARSLTQDKKFVFDSKHLKKYYSSLHPTIHESMIKLAAHRGDKAGHGKTAPYAHEIRYLLFSVCNTALLLLDYPKESLGPGLAI